MLDERVAQIQAHRACCGSEHDPANGKLHGYCVVCGVPFPCEYVGKPPQVKNNRGRGGMDTGSGHLYYQDKIDMKNIKGQLVPWEVGEFIEVKGCRFKVKEIKVFPEDEITLVGMPKNISEELTALTEKIPITKFEDTQHGILNFVRRKK